MKSYIKEIELAELDAQHDLWDDIDDTVFYNIGELDKRKWLTDGHHLVEEKLKERVKLIKQQHRAMMEEMRARHIRHHELGLDVHPRPANWHLRFVKGWTCA